MEILKTNNYRADTNILLDYLETAIGDEMILNSFIRNLQIIHKDDLEVIVKADSINVINFIEENYKEVLTQAIEATYNKNLVYKLTNINLETKENNENSKVVNQNINTKYSFENYVVSSFNKEVVSIVKKTIDMPGKFSPVFIAAKSGLGKTHLLHAIGNEIAKKNLSAIYIEPNRFTKEIYDISKNNQNLNAYIEKYNKYDFLLFDDIQILSDRNTTLNVFFNIINNHIEKEKQIIICSDKPSKELTGFEKRFITRFSSGLSSKIKTPNLEDLIEILNFKLNKENLKPESWDKEAIDFIARNNSYSIRSLEGAIKRVLFFKETNPKIKYTFGVVKNIFSDINVDQIELTPQRIINTICSYYKINKKDLISKSRKQEFVIARHMAIWLIKKINNLPYVEIGKLFNNRDHSTIIFAIKNIDKQMEQNQSIKMAAEKIEDKIKKNI